MAKMERLSLHEAVFLLNCYLEVVKQNIPVTHMAKVASESLRQMAQNSGMAIDSGYRSVVSIFNRLISMGNTFTGKKVGSKAFVDAVDLYKNQHEAYEQMLSEAKAMMSNRTDRKELLIEGAKDRTPEKQLNRVESNADRGGIPEADKLDIDSKDDAAFTLKAIPSLVFTKPVSYSYQGSPWESVAKWSSLYISVLRRLGEQQCKSIKCQFGTASFSEDGSSMRRPFEVWPGVYTEMNFSAADRVKRLKMFFECADIDLDSLAIKYKRLETEMPPEVREIPGPVSEAIRRSYRGGLRFDETVLRLLEDQVHNKLDDATVRTLKAEMFKRSDDLYFLSETITPGKVQDDIKATLLENLDRFGLCELEGLYTAFTADGGSACLRSAEDYGDFLLYLLPDSIRIVSVLGFKIVKRAGIATKDAVAMLSDKLVASVKKNGYMTEDDLLNEYPVVAGAFIRKVFEKDTDEIVATTINGILCYQTIEALGFDESFSDLLSSVLDKASELDLMPSEEALHVLLSMEIGQNFKEAYGIPDDKTFRRVITMYYKGECARTWKAGKFIEE